jgi:hypothetical protein
MKAPCPNCANFVALADLAETPALVCRACRSGARLALGDTANHGAALVWVDVETDAQDAGRSDDDR